MNVFILTLISQPFINQSQSDRKLEQKYVRAKKKYGTESPQLAKVKKEISEIRKKEMPQRLFNKLAGTHLGGVFESTEEAISFAKKNPQEMDEAGYYPQLVIERLETGGGSIPTQEIWMQRTKKGPGYERIRKPTWAQGTIAFCG